VIDLTAPAVAFVQRLGTRMQTLDGSMVRLGERLGLSPDVLAPGPKT